MIILQFVKSIDHLSTVSCNVPLAHTNTVHGLLFTWLVVYVACCLQTEDDLERMPAVEKY